jgi:autotransporter-associated beta strand protein
VSPAGVTTAVGSNPVFSLTNSTQLQYLLNDGTIQSYYAGSGLLYVDATSSLNKITNNGTLWSSDFTPTIYNNGGSINSIINNSIFSNGRYNNSISNNGTIGSIVNNASASISSGNSAAISNASQGVIGSFVNLGAISGYASAPISNSGIISSFTNIGSISSPRAGDRVVNNSGTLTTLNNAQGGDSSTLSTSVLKYTGILPTAYNIIINSPTNYGQLSVTSPSGSMAFGIYGGATNFSPVTYTNSSGSTSSVAASTIAAGTYADVLQGFSSLSSLSGTTGSYSGFNYRLIADTANSGMWNLVLTAATTNILPGSTNLLSSLGGTLNPVLEGGILKVDSSGMNSTAFTITTAGGVIDQSGMSPVFVGGFADSAVGVHGKLTIINSGTGGSVGLAGVNTYSGGTEVDAGANLVISSASNIGTGALALVGTSTTPATLTTIANMTIANAITVSGDPVFSVAPNTTTTIAAPITDGVPAGDVVVSGGGTLNLTAVNTYTGQTTVDAGSTLALSGSGSIATSSSLTNKGSFDITGKGSNVSVASYTQSSTGNLAMNFSAGSNQQLLVTGAASLAGGLSLNANSGTYSAGKYTLLTANGLTGTFSSLSTNLASFTRLGYGLTYDANDVYLVFTPNSADTQQSLVNISQALQSTFTLQNSVLANSFSYDCTEFGANGICISAGGRNTAVQAEGINNTSGLLIAAYRPHPSYRMGAYADQNLSTNSPGGTVKLGNNTPLIGAFAAWNERLDGTGAEIKVSAAYGQKNATVTRAVVGTSDPGTGSSNLISQGAQITAKYGFAVIPEVIVSPYLGIRYTQNNMGGYTEGTSATVTAPLTYSALNTNATTALAGVGASYRVIPTVMTFASAGVETDTNTANGTYSASGVTGLTPVNFNANPVKTRPTVTVGAYYDIEKNQRLGITGIYRQEPYQAVSTTTVLATYTVGL